MTGVEDQGYVDGNTQVFPGTVMKTTKDGTKVLSDRVGKGEKLAVRKDPAPRSASSKRTKR